MFETLNNNFNISKKYIKKMSAKKIEIDWKRVDKLLQAHCHGVGIAGLLGINENTLYSRCRSDLGEEFEAKKQQKQAEGKELLRAKQFELAMMGNVPMAIWLGKNLLGQRDQVEQTVNLPKIVLQPFDKDDLGIIKEAFDFLEKSETTN